MRMGLLGGWKKKDPLNEEVLSAPQDAGPPSSNDCPQCAARMIEIDGKISKNRDRIKDIIHDVQKLSIEEVLAIGNCINSIVSHTRSYIADSKASLEKNFAKQSDFLETYIAQSRETVKAQGKTVEHALTLSGNISGAGEAVDKLAREAKLLALNATIEAARMGSSGNAFGVISDEMNHLSDEIAKANRLIEGAIDAIRKSLPSILKQTTTQMEKIEEFTLTMKDLKGSIEQSMSFTGNAGDNQLDTILDLSYSALSHLQFQDPMVQELEKVNAILLDCHRNLSVGFGLPFSEKYVDVNSNKLEIDKKGRNGFEGKNEPGSETKSDADQIELSESEQEAGDVLLF